MANTYYLLRDYFSNFLLKDYGISVTYTPVTKTISGDYGDETLTDGTPSTITVIPKAKIDISWKIVKLGEMTDIDAFILVAYTQTINKNDKITYQSKTYRVKDVDEIYVNGYIVYKRANLYIIS